jgi:hypothetical protein
MKQIGFNLTVVGGASSGRKWLERPEGRSASMMVHRAPRPLFTVLVNMVKGCYDVKQHSQNSLELQECFNMSTATCFSGFGGLAVSMLASGTQDSGFAPG